MSGINLKCRHCDTWELNTVSKGEGCLGRTPAPIIRKARFWLLCYWLVTKSCPTLAIPWTVATRLLCPWNSPGKNTEVGCHFLLQGIFLTQESNPSLLHCRQILLPTELWGKPYSNYWVQPKVLGFIWWVSSPLWVPFRFFCNTRGGRPDG